MCRQMVHRGPDDGGYYLNSFIGLVHRRLSIIDLSPAGHQPMSNEEGTLWITYNGEVYNFPELRVELESKGYRFRSHTDTEVILHLYQELGEKCLERLNGIFAFAIWDAKRNKLFLARDRLGIKPLYYYVDNEKLVFASEVRAILESRIIPKKLSLSGLCSYLALGAVQDPLTMVDGIYALPAGHYGTCQDRVLKIKPYWKLPEGIDKDIARLSREEISGRIKELLLDSTRIQLISDVPLVVFLSGGIDSSTIVALTSQVSDIPIKTISIIFQEQKFSETPYMRMVANKFMTDHVEVLLTADDMLNELPEALAAMDQPTFDGINTYIVSKHTKASGLTVALSGLGGDELFAGYNSFKWAPILQKMKRLTPGLLGQAMGSFMNLFYGDSDRGIKLSRWFKGECPDGNAYLLVRELFTADDIQRLVPELNGNYHLPSDSLSGFSTSDPVDWVSRCELSYYMLNVLLRDTDVMSMAHGLEVRVPFLDHRLVEMVLSIPGKMKLDEKTPKSLLVSALDGLLPGELIYRKKQGFVLPFSVWVRGVLKKQIEDTLLKPNSGGPMADILDHQSVYEIWNRFLTGRANWVRPWALYVLKSWCEVYFKDRL